MKKILLLLTLLLSLASLGLAKIPKWFNKTELPDYPAENFICATGEGQNYDEAFTNAQAAIATQLRVKIQSEVNSYVSEINENDRSSYKDIFETASTATVDETLTGAKIILKENSKGKYYVFAVLDRHQYTTGLQVELDDLWNPIIILVEDARKYIQTGKIIAALDNFTDAQELMTQFYPKKAFHDATAQIPYIMTDSISVAGLDSEIRDLLTGISIEVASGNEQTTENGSYLPLPIQLQVQFKKLATGHVIPITQMPLLIKDDDGNTLDKPTTGTDGLAETRVKVYTQGANQGKLIAKVNPYRLPGLYRKYLNNAETTIYFNTTAIQARVFSINVKNENGERLSDVEDIVARAVEKAGHTVAKNAEFILEGTVQVSGIQQVQGTAGMQYIADTELTLFLIPRNTGEKIASCTASGKGLSQQSERQATENAFKKIKINQKKFTDMLAEAK
jgi:hypothetical protein